MSLGEEFHCKYSLIERSGEDSLHLGVLVHCFPLTVLGLLTPDRSWLFYRFTAMCMDDSATIQLLYCVAGKVKIGGEGRGRRREVAYEKLWWSLACVIAVHSFTHTHVQLRLVSVLINVALFLFGV